MKKNVFSVLLVLVILFVFPAISYWYLREGFSYRKAALSELGNYGSLPKLQILTIDGTVLQSDSVGKTVFYAAFINDAHRASRKNLSALFNQFKDRVDYTFLLVDGDSNEEGFKRQQDGAKFYHFVAPSATIDSICGLFAKDEQAPMMLMSDTKGNIRNFYKSFESVDFQHIVKQTTVLLPVTKTVKPQLTRDVEK